MTQNGLSIKGDHGGQVEKNVERTFIRSVERQVGRTYAAAAVDSYDLTLAQRQQRDTHEIRHICLKSTSLSLFDTTLTLYGEKRGGGWEATEA